MIHSRMTLAWLAAVWLASFTYFGTIFVLNVHSDLQPHANSIISLSEGRTPPPANFLYFLSVYLVALCSTNQSSLYRAASVVLGAAVTAKGIVTYRFLKSDLSQIVPERPIPTSALLLLSTLMLIIFSLPTAGPGTGVAMYLGQIPPNVWHNSTTIFLMPFALLLFFKSGEQLERPENLKGVGVLSGLCLLNVLAKPSFLFVFCLAYPLMLLRAQGWGRLFWLNVIPAVVGASLVGLQYFLIYKLSFGNLHQDKSSVTIAPLQVWSVISSNIPASLLASLAFPLTYLAFYWHDALGNRLIQYSLVCYLIGLAVFCVFAEQGPRAEHSNFMWQSVVSGYILFLVLLSHFVGKAMRHGLRTWPNRLIFAAFSLHVVSGVLYLAKMIAWRCY